MKVTLTFKTPDVADQMDTQEERDAMEAVIEKFVEYGEYVRIELDSETMCATVLEV